jgi:xanthine/CO dehydrogenase XdhC/CoxF family maturation factor
VRDLKYLYELVGKEVVYIGLLGPSKRKEKLLNDLIEKSDLISEGFFDKIYGPAGINIGAETPQEIAISILGEILSVIRNQKPIYLKDKQIGIHQ